MRLALLRRSQLLVMGLCGALVGCASVGALFISYSEAMQPVRLQLQLGQWSEAQAAIPDSSVGDNNYVLDRLQQGRIAFLRRDWSGSQRSWMAAATELNWQDQQAEYRISHGLQQAGSLLSNDQTMAYQTPDYEQTLLHHYLALSYLFMDQTSDALVEIRQANQAQERALARRDEQLQASAEEIEQAGLGESLALAQQGLPPQPAGAESLKGKVQSGYTFYLSALLYEATGELNDAYVDYRRALEVAPTNRMLQRDLLRLTQRMGLKQEYQQLVAENRPAKLLFRGGGSIGANALAIPNNTIIVTDELVKLAKNDYELIGVLAHEQGHLVQRHSLQQSLSGLGISIILLMITGDGSDILTSLPVAAVGASYSRDFESEADLYALKQLSKHQIPTAHFANFLQRMEDEADGETAKEKDAKDETVKDQRSWTDFFESHPATKARIDAVRNYQSHQH